MLERIAIPPITNPAIPTALSCSDTFGVSIFLSNTLELLLLFLIAFLAAMHNIWLQCIKILLAKILNNLNK